MRELPELNPRITPEEIKASAKLGSGVDLRRLVSFLKLFGAFGASDNDNRGIAARLYETKELREFDPISSQIVVRRDDETAYLRFDNIISGRHSMSLREIAFFRQCLQYCFGENTAAMISEDEIRCGSASLLIRRLLSESPEFDLGDLDPVTALKVMALGAEPGLTIKIQQRDADRWVRHRAGEKAAFPSPDLLVLPDGFRFSLEVGRSLSPPLLLNFAAATGVSESGAKVRAQCLPAARPSKDDNSIWTVRDRRGGAFEIESSAQTSGDFGFLAIAGAGLSAAQLFGADHNPAALTDSDLRRLVESLATLGRGAGAPMLGLLEYRVERQA